MALGASRFGFGALRRSALTGSLPALERLFIAFSVGSGEGIVPGRRATPKVAYACSSNEPLRRQPLTQRLRLFQITRIKSLSQLAIDRQFACFLGLTLVAPVPRDAHSGRISAVCGA